MKATWQIPDIELTAEIENGLAAVEAFRIHRPDVTLTDLQMPRLGGIDALIAIRILIQRQKPSLQAALTKLSLREYGQGAPKKHRRKLRANDRTHAVVLAMKRGYFVA